MSVIQDRLIFLYTKIKQSCFDYRVTVGAVVLVTLYETICYILNSLDFESNVLRFMLFFILAVMLTESVFSYEKKEQRTKIVRILCFVLSAVMAAVFIGAQNIVAINHDIQNYYSMTKSGYVIAEWSGGTFIEKWAMRYYIGCILLLMLGIIYFCHKKSGCGFIEYMMHVSVNFCVTTAIYIVLWIGVILVLTVLELLFLDNRSSLSGYSFILLTGFYYVPGCIAALRNMDSNIEDEISKVLIKKVLSGMTVCAMAIVYAYLLKILVTWEMPSNEIFGIVSGLFCISMFIWVIDWFYRDDTKYTVFLQRLPYGIIPMIPVQAYAMGVRIYHNGMTTGRYMGMLLVAFEIIMLFIWRFWRDKMERVIIVLCICVVVAVYLPGVNMFSVSNRWQQSILTTVYDKVVSQQEIEQQEYDRMMGAYKYLRRQPEMADVIERYDIYDDGVVQMLVISDLDTEDMTSLDSHYIHCCQLVSGLNVNEYSRFDMVNQDPQYKNSDYKKLEGEHSVDFTAFRFYKRSDGEEKLFEVDISDFADKCFAYEEEYPDATQDEISNAMRPYQRIVIDDDTVLYLNHFEVRYTDGVKDGKDYFDWGTINISGMLLSR